MGADEEGTHERLKARLRELIEPKIAEHRGRVVKNTGDGFLAEFQSVVDAVRCAVQIQRGMADSEPEMPEERRIRLARLPTRAYVSRMLLLSTPVCGRCSGQ
jgi:adenylate cyclase